MSIFAGLVGAACFHPVLENIQVCAGRKMP